VDKISSQVSWLQEFCDHLVENSLSRSSSAAAGRSGGGRAAEARGAGSAKPKREGATAKRKREKSAGGESGKGGEGKRSAMLGRLADGLEGDDERVGSLSAAVAAADSEELCSAFTHAEGEPSTPLEQGLEQGLSREMDLRLLGAEEGAGGLPCEAPEPGPSSLQGERQLDGIVPHGRFAAEHDDSDGGGVGSPSCALADGSTLMEAISPDALSPHGLMSPAGFGVDVDELLKIVDTSSREQAVLDVLSSPRGVPLITLSAAFDPPAADAGKISGKLSAEACDESLPPAPTAGKRRPCNGTPDHPPSAAAAAAAAAAIATNVPSGPATVPAVGTSSQERKKSARVAAARTSVLPADPSRAHAAGATGASSSGAAGASAEADSGEPAGGICRGEGGGGAGFAYGPGAAFGSAVPQLVASPARAPPLAFEPLHRSPMLLHSPHPPMRMIARSLT
jgi:hypothetical protein